MLPMPKLKKGTPLYRVAFYGPMVAGKSTAAKYLVDSRGYTLVSFAAKLKLLAWDLFGIEGKGPEARLVLQKLGTEYMRSIDDLVWIKHALLRMESLGDDARIVLDDVRFINEAKWLKKNGFILILVDTPEEIRTERISRLYPETPPEAHTHSSEQEYTRIKPDFTISGVGYDTHANLDVIFKNIR